MGFFSKEPVAPLFTAYSPLHWAVLAVLVLAIVLTVVFRARLRAHPRVRRFLPVWIGCVAWTFEIMYHTWTYVQDLDFVFNVIPLELCYVSLILTVVLAITRSRAVFEIYYFISVGALMSVLFPAFGGYGPTHLRFWHYFICHSYIVWLNAWYLAVERYGLRRTALLRLAAFMIPFAAIVKFVDWKFSVNYMFLAGPSAGSSPLDFLGKGIMYLVELAGMAVVIFGIMYICAPKDHGERLDAVVEKDLAEDSSPPGDPVPVDDDGPDG